MENGPVQEKDPLSIEFFRLHHHAVPVQSAGTRRDWMDETDQRFAYRCTPILIANASGWEFTCPFAFDVEWTGEPGRDAIRISTGAGPAEIEALIGSHFGHGIVTFHTGWLMRSSPGWATWARGSPNGPKDGIAPLEGIVETEWLPFPFTMNWRFTAPCTVRFEKDEPFCFVTPMPQAPLEKVQPVLREIAEDPELLAAFTDWSESRSKFNTGLVEGDVGVATEKWQKNYARGTHPFARTGAHQSKRSLASPFWIDKK